MKKLSAIILTLAILLTAVSLTACGGTTLDLQEYTTVEFKGVDGKATASIDFDFYSFTEAYVSSLNVSDPYSEKALEITMKFSAFEDSFDYEVSPSEGLSNGDEVEVNFTYSESAAKEIGIKLQNTSYKVTVEGLTEAIEIDAFDTSFFNTDTGVMIEYEGIAPKGYLRIYNKVPDTNPASKVKYSADSSGVKYGENIIITASLPYGAEDEGYVLKEETYEYPLTNVAHNIATTDIPAADKLTALKEKVASILKGESPRIIYGADNKDYWGYDVKLQNARVGDLYLMEKKDGTFSQEGLVSVYADYVKEDETWKNAIAFYIVRDLYIQADGTLKFDVIYLSDFYANDDIAEKRMLHDYRTDYNIQTVSFE